MTVAPAPAPLARASGIPLHPSSLPGPYGSGDFGEGARHFVDWLQAAGQGLWQVLPLGPVGPGQSPYMSPSAFAVNPLFVDLAPLVERGWLPRVEVPDFALGRIDYARMVPFRMQCLRRAAAGFFASVRHDARHREAFDAFVAAQADWLDDYALFMAIDERWNGRVWSDWEPALARREPAALAAARRELADAIDFWRFVQWHAHGQWQAVRGYANARGVRIVGDIPIFVALHSADVWAHPELFHLDPVSLKPTVVAGVPPDYFSATGQLWGNPLYRWARHADTGYAWWIRRIRAMVEQADVVRIDHFRGFAGYWEIPAGATTAIDGRWVEGPGAALFDALRGALGTVPVIAEDLGVITPEITALRERFGLPGMRVLQFAFGDDARNPYLPHNYAVDTVAYTGTHDNDTSVGWFAAAGPRERAFAQTYLQTDGREIHWDLIRAASQSVAAMAIYPFQDVLGLDASARMNVPGQAEGHWSWRFAWTQVPDWPGRRLRAISAAHGRNGVGLDGVI
jgi:4-alpha-glucanotransferase